MMCHDLTSELAQFDLQKEKEFRQVLLDYAAAQLEKHEKVCGSLVSSSVQDYPCWCTENGTGLGMRLVQGSCHV